MQTNKDWKIFFEAIDNRAVDSLLNIAEDTEDVKQAIV